MAAEQEGEESKQVEQQGDHRAGIVSGSEPTDQPLAADRGFGEGQAGSAYSGFRSTAPATSSSCSSLPVMPTEDTMTMRRSLDRRDLRPRDLLALALLR